jgi:hypothetical protein
MDFIITQLQMLEKTTTPLSPNETSFLIMYFLLNAPLMINILGIN